MKNFKKSAVKFTVKILLLWVGVGGGLCSCSETDDTQEEFANWQEVNETAFINKYKQAISSSTDNLDTLRCYSLLNKNETKPEDYVIVEKLAPIEGMKNFGKGCPLYTDTVSVSYRGRLQPSLSYADGYVFDESFSGDYNLLLSQPTKFVVGGTVSGFATALQNMCIGDHWRVYMPYQLAYGTTASSSIPGYSMLTFDIILEKYW